MTEIFRFAVIQNGTVANVTQSSRQYASTQDGWIESDQAQIGDAWDGQSFTRPAPPPAPEPATPMLDQLAAELNTTPEELAMLLGGG